MENKKTMILFYGSEVRKILGLSVDGRNLEARRLMRKISNNDSRTIKIEEIE